MRNLLIIIGVLAFILSPRSIVLAGETPSEVVKEYCQLDYEGARFSSREYESIQSLVSYQEEPGWDVVLGVTSFEIISEQISGDKAKVKVKYNIKQSWPLGAKINDIEVVKLRKTSGGWKIAKYIKYPRVSTEVLCRRYNKCKKSR